MMLTGHWRHCRQCTEGLLQHPPPGPGRPTADVVDVFQPAEAAQLPEEEHAARETEIFHHEQHRLRAVLALAASRHAECAELWSSL